MQGVGHGRDRSDIVREQVGAIEHDRGQRTVIQVEPKHAVLRTCLGLCPVIGAEAAQVGHEGEGAGHVGGAAVAETGVEPGKRVRRHGGQRGKRRVRAAIAGEHCERDGAGAAEGGQFFGAVTPVVEPAKQAQHDTARVGGRLLEVEVHRERVAQLAERGEPQGGWAVVRAGERTEVGVREGEHQQVRGTVPEVDRGGGFVERAGFTDQEVHQASAAAMAARSMPVWPITTNWPRRSSPCAQGRS